MSPEVMQDQMLQMEKGFNGVGIQVRDINSRALKSNHSKLTNWGERSESTNAQYFVGGALKHDLDHAKNSLLFFFSEPETAVAVPSTGWILCNCGLVQASSLLVGLVSMSQ